MLARSNRLTSGEDFRRALRQGRRAGSRTVVVHAYATEGLGPTRVGFAVSRAVGNAVVRNQVKRRLRHAVRGRLPELRDGSLVVVRALPAAATAGFAELQADLAHCLAKVGMESTP